VLGYSEPWDGVLGYVDGGDITKRGCLPLRFVHDTMIVDELEFTP
jgi:hypothetical protein